jgi:hypothetical protein
VKRRARKEVDAERGRSRSEIAKSAARSTASSSVRMRERKRPPCGGLSGGPRRARTAGLRRATAALSQLSYGPVELRQCSSELEILGPVDPKTLVVLCRSEPELNRRPVDRHLDWQQETHLKRGAVCGYGVDLTLAVAAGDKSLGSAAVCSASDRHHIAPTNGPFALNAQKLWPKIKDEVVTLVSERSQYASPVSHCLESNCLFGEGALLIGRQHGQHSTRATGRTVAAKGNVSL